MRLEPFLEETRAWVDAALDRFLPAAGREPRRLHEAMRWSVFAGGKRLRPALARAACRVLGGTDDAVVASACALEMLHTYSLIHDDLPALDDDDLRRGRPTCHKRFGEATAILAGDALQTEAFRVLAAHTPDPAIARALVVELAEAAGTGGMVGGELADLEAEGSAPDLPTVEFIHARKTAALLRAAATMGARAAGADEAARTALARYGDRLGLAFQIVDDVLDETGTAESLGKSPGKDRVAGKMSYPAAVGLDASLARARLLADEAVDALAGLDGEGLLVELARFTVDRLR